MSSLDALTDSIPVMDERLPDMREMTAEKIYNAYGSGSVIFHDMLTVPLELTIEALKAMPQTPAIHDAIVHLDHYLLELGYEAERDY